MQGGKDALVIFFAVGLDGGHGFGEADGGFGVVWLAAQLHASNHVIVLIPLHNQNDHYSPLTNHNHRNQCLHPAVAA